jgi:hydroxymethylpyrimidine/phosphomethylpyrimidine kinase
MTPQTPPLVLCLSGHDPSGGAGIQADIEAIRAQGAHALSLITSLTLQDTRNVEAVEPVPLPWLQRQWALLRADSQVSAVKVGLLGNAAQADWLAGIVRTMKVPVVVDPVLKAGGGARLAEPAFLDRLLPTVTVLTPNAAEAAQLAPDAADPAAQGEALRRRGCAHVLVTGGDLPGDRVRNWWVHAGGVAVFEWPRVAAAFHGAGCTLASTLAARLALGQPVAEAIETAQREVHGMLTRGSRIGQGRLIPGRGP